MNPGNALLVAALACAWCLAPPVHASGNDAHGHVGASQGNAQAMTRANPPASASAQGYGDNAEIGLPPGTPATHNHASAGSTGNTGSCGDNASGIGSLFAACENHAANQGNSGDNGDADMGWQSMLPGSIQ